jgi:acetoin utilization deacetylase AcuC-like enzyme
VIRRELERTALFEPVAPAAFPEDWILAVHDAALVGFLKRASAAVGEGESVYPYVFPLRNKARPPREYPLRAGYFCMDTFTPIHRNAWRAARRAVDCTLTAARAVADGRRFAYALVRPPGHHAERQAFGGFCYLNSAAIAANYLSSWGRVALLDIDYHHGNGHQDIFYRRSDVLTISIHGNPRDTYPYFSGFADEQGEGPGTGYNLNLPLPEGIDGSRYRVALRQALAAVKSFAPRFLVVSLGLDTARNDPTGSWTLTGKDFAAHGGLVGGLGLPTLVVQEGGYNTRTLGSNARQFFAGLVQG